jgi:ABC-type transport system involved in multi-copper enzyme maturation permease subunit
VNRVVIAETVRRHVTHPGYIVFLALMVILALAVSVFDRPASGWPSLVWLLALIAGCGVIGPEFSSGTLQLVLVKPVNRAVYLFSRAAGVVLTVWLVAIVAALCELAGRALWGDTGTQARAIGAALLNVGIETLLSVALLALLGSLTRAYFNIAIYMVALIGFNLMAVALAFVRQTGNAVGRFLNEHMGIERGLAVVAQNLFPDRPFAGLDVGWTLMVLSNAAVALLLACLAFRRREVPYGAD